LIFKQRHGAKVTKKRDRATTPHQRAITAESVRKMPAIRMNAAFKQIKPATINLPGGWLEATGPYLTTTWLTRYLSHDTIGPPFSQRSDLWKSHALSEHLRL